MDSPIDFEVIALLEKAPSKKYIRKLIEDSFLLRNNLESFNKYLQTPVFQNNMGEMGLNQEQNNEVNKQKIVKFRGNVFSLERFFLNLVKLINECTKSKDPMSVFPESFNASLSEYISDLIAKEIQANWSKIIAKDIAESSTFLNIDWRLDNQVSTDSDKKTQNQMVFLDIESQKIDSGELKVSSFQLNKQELLNLYDNFSKIKEQLSMLVSE